jgi:hypothetical protein
LGSSKPAATGFARDLAALASSGHLAGAVEMADSPANGPDPGAITVTIVY